MGVDALVKLGEHWWRTARQRDGTPLYAREPLPFLPTQVSQAEMTEAQVSPDSRTPFSFRDLSGGAGQADTPLTGDNTKYDRIGDAEGEGVDASLTPAAPVVLAAEVNTVTLTPGGTDNFLGTLWKGGSNTAYLAVGRYVFSWLGAGTFTNVGDLGVGTAASDALLPYRGVDQTQDYWYAALGYGATPKFSTDSGATWTACTTTGGFDKVQSMVVVDGTVVFARQSPRAGLGNAMVASFDNGGTTPTMFGVIDPVGDPAFAITRLMAFQDRVLALKDGEGVFLLAGDRKTLEQEVFPELKGAKLYAAGAKVWRGVLWLPTDRGLFAVTPDFTLVQVGPEQRAAATVKSGRGVVTAVAGDGHNLYAWRYVAAGQPSWLVKGVGAGAGDPRGVAWHDYLQLADGAQCQRMDALAPGGNGPRLLLDRETSAGAFTLYYLRTPAQGRDPRADPNFRYCAAGTLYYSRLQGRFPALNKFWFGAHLLLAPLETAVDGATASTAQAARARWKLDTTALSGVSPFGYTQGQAQTSGTGRHDEIALRGRGLDTAVRLTSSDPTTTPQLYAHTSEFDVIPDNLWRHVFTLEVGAGSVDGAGLGGAAAPMTPEAAVAYLATLPGSGPVDLVDLWGGEYSVTIKRGGLRLRAGQPPEAGYSGDVPLLVEVVATEQSAVEVGTYGSLDAGFATYAAMDANFATYGDMAA